MGSILYGGAIHIREQAKIEAGRVTQKSGNERRGAESELARFSASLGNQRIMDAAGKNINAITENITRNLDAASFGTFMGRIAAAEELGSSVAAAAAAGVGGSSIEAYNSTMRLNAAMQEEQTDRAINSDVITASRAKGDTLSDSIGNLDNNLYLAQQDFTQFVDHQKASALGGVAALAIAAGATYFGGPQAGMAVLKVHEAGQAAKNGDFAGASQNLTSAMGDAVSGFKAYRAGAGEGQSGSPVGKQLWESTKRAVSGAKLKI